MTGYRKQRSEDFWAGVFAAATLLLLAAMMAGMWYMIGLVEEHAPKNDPVETFTPPEPQVWILDPEETALELEEEPVLHYPLTEAERDEVAHVLMCETGGVDALAAELVATCVLNACEKDGLRPGEVFERYQYATYPAEPNAVCYAAIQTVFDNGTTATEEPIMFFYSPANMPDGVSAWHETQDFVLEYAGHRYFKLKGVQAK